MNKVPNLYVALPVINESANISDIVVCLTNQNLKTFKLIVCVNQYESWWDDSDKVHICKDNNKSIRKLYAASKLEIEIIDKSSKGNGWPAKKGGVGWARKTIMDHIASKANKNDIIVSIDADTYYPPNYLQSILDFFVKNNKIGGLASPYYHRLDDELTNRLILRYEIYMRYYLINMMRINNPYAYTALGSAMAFPVWAYKKAGGLTPVTSGEDFYFLQKLVKNGKVGIWSSSIAFPSSRFSDRVLFGTGPALIKGQTGDWNSYPNYHFSLFDEIHKTFSMFSNLFTEEIKTPMDEFLIDQTKTDDIWTPLRKNYKDELNFVRACQSKVDGLRILQYLRKQQTTINLTDEGIIFDFLVNYCKDEIDDELLAKLEKLDYGKSSIVLLGELRDFLFRKEMEMRKNIMYNVEN